MGGKPRIRKAENYVLVLRQCDARRQGHGGFQYPQSGLVECPDWDPAPTCGNGLHGFLRGEGDGALADKGPDGVWLVLRVLESDVVRLGDDKVKFPRAEVIYSGSQNDAAAILVAAYPNAKVIGAHVSAGYAGTATAGYAGTATAGDYGTATAGDRGTAAAGNAGTATAGDYGTATAGGHGTATAGYYGTATAGNAGTATAGNAGTATAGYAGTATAGYAGTATAGGHGTATAGDHGTATADAGGEIRLRWWDGRRYRAIIGYIGENGLKPNTPYRLDIHGNFEEKPNV